MDSLPPPPTHTHTHTKKMKQTELFNWIYYMVLICTMRCWNVLGPAKEDLGLEIQQWKSDCLRCKIKKCASTSTNREFCWCTLFEDFSLYIFLINATLRINVQSVKLLHGILTVFILLHILSHTHTCLVGKCLLFCQIFFTLYT